MRYVTPPSILKDIGKDFMLWLDDVYHGRFRSIKTAEVNLDALSADPDDPATNRSLLWQSDGTGSGDDGDIMIKITDSGGTTKTETLVDYSAI